MRILFINFTPIDIPAGHTFRLVHELSDLCKKADIHILCAKKGSESKSIKRHFKKVVFSSFELEFDGWEIKNVDQFIAYVEEYDRLQNFDLIVLNMEVWSLIRRFALSKLQSKFCVVFHGVPFIGYLNEPTWNFNKDALSVIKNTKEKYKKFFNKNYYLECEEFMSKINCIASSKTSSHYLKKYFGKVKIWNINKYPRPRLHLRWGKKDFDLAYMARIEHGKGLEYIRGIVESVYLKSNREIRVAIMGKTDDTISKVILDSLLQDQSENISFEYFGHADDNIKQKVLSNSKVFIYPSVYDNNPTVIYEAISFGLPIVMWNTAFSRLNFDRLSFVKLTKFKDIEKFAQNCIDLMEYKGTHNKEVKHFFDTKLFASMDIADFDLKLFNKI